MPQTHRPYPPEYRRRIVELARAGRSVNALAHEFEPSASAFRYSLKQAGLGEGLRSGGYRRVTALLCIEGCRINRKRVQRIWRREGLKLAVKQSKRWYLFQEFRA